ncbi:hypothetical protein JNW90_16865 [Micromonospora sp. STR1s_5]|nr:hypothetical protein [Micromonospora sp. STR1s_5]
MAYILRFLVSSSSEFQIAWLRLLNRRQRQKIRKNVERLERAEIEFRSTRYLLDQYGGSKTVQGQQLLEQLSRKLQDTKNLKAEILLFQEEVESDRKEMKRSFAETRKDQIRKLEAIVEGIEIPVVDSSKEASKTGQGADASSHSAAT